MEARAKEKSECEKNIFLSKTTREEKLKGKKKLDEPASRGAPPAVVMSPKVLRFFFWPPPPMGSCCFLG